RSRRATGPARHHGEPRGARGFGRSRRGRDRSASRGQRAVQRRRRDEHRRARRATGAGPGRARAHAPASWTPHQRGATAARDREALMADAVIRVEQLSRRFGNFQAVDNLSFDVRRGEVFGFLGANGAGKSTTIRMLCGLLKPSGGRAEVAGLDVGRDPEGVKRHIGYMSQRFSLYELLTVDQNISFYGGLYGLESDRLATRRKFVIDMAGLAGRERELAKNLSGGWRQRLALGCALLHEPPIIFLDEPTGGV